MGNALIVLVVPEEVLGYAPLYVRRKGTEGMFPVTLEMLTPVPRGKRRPKNAVMLLPVALSDVYSLPAEPWDLNWHFDPKLLEGHKATVARSIEKYLNGNLKRLDQMARSGWFIIGKARVQVSTLEEVPHASGEKPFTRRTKAKAAPRRKQVRR